MSRLPHDWFDPCQLDDIVRVTVSNHGPAPASAPWARTRTFSQHFGQPDPVRVSEGNLSPWLQSRSALTFRLVKRIRLVHCSSV